MQGDYQQLIDECLEAEAAGDDGCDTTEWQNDDPSEEFIDDDGPTDVWERPGSQRAVMSSAECDGPPGWTRMLASLEGARR